MKRKKHWKISSHYNTTIIRKKVNSRIAGADQAYIYVWFSAIADDVFVLKISNQLMLWLYLSLGFPDEARKCIVYLVPIKVNQTKDEQNLSNKETNR